MSRPTASAPCIGRRQVNLEGGSTISEELGGCGRAPLPWADDKLGKTVERPIEDRRLTTARAAGAKVARIRRAP